MACVSSDKLCGIPGEVMDILAAMQCQKLGKPTWTVFSTGGGLGVKLFWRNGNRGTRTPINANQREKPKLRKQRDQRRLEEFNRKKRQERTPNVEGVMQPVTEPGKPASELLGIPASMSSSSFTAGGARGTGTTGSTWRKSPPRSSVFPPAEGSVVLGDR